MSLDKKDWVCTQPFEFAEIFDESMFMCCPDWLPVDLGNPNNVSQNWQSDKAKAVRESVTDGSYRFCDENRCPKLRGLKEGRSEGFISKHQYDKVKDQYQDKFPEQLKFNFDRSCNLKCPSCRIDFINYDGDKRERTEELIRNIEDQLSKGLKMIDCTGTGDPFFSRTFRKWMMTFDSQKYPNLERIHLHTNGTLWNESNWTRMPNIHQYVKSAEISMDAATKETYETKTRIGGNWDKLIENIHFISEIDTIERLTFSFVVQKDNFKEVEKFYKLIKSIFRYTNIHWVVQYTKVVNWGTFTDKQFKEVNVGDPSHPNFTELMEIFNRIPKNHHIVHNLPTDSKWKKTLL